MRFMDLPDDIFIDIVHFLDEEWYQDRNAALAAIRLTCKRLHSSAQSRFFANIRVTIERDDIPSLINLAETVGYYVRDLNLDLWMDLDNSDGQKSRIKKLDVHLATLIRRLPNIRTLTIRTISNASLNLPQFVLSVGTLTQVRHLQLIEGASSTSPTLGTPLCCPVSDGVVHEVVQASGDQLLSLVFDGQSQLAPETFDVIRRIPKNLHTLLLRECIGLSCRAAICEEVPWACRKSLLHLGFYDCRGAHSGGIVAGIGKGLWSTCLRTLEVCKSGDHSDVPRLPYELYHVGYTPPTLERAHFEHAFPWEILLLGQLKVRELTLTYLPKKDMLDLVLGNAFPGMSKLTTCTPPGAVVQLGDGVLKAACDSRSVELSLDASPIIGCTCQYGTD